MTSTGAAARAASKARFGVTATPTGTLIQGFGESLNNVALAIALAVMAGVAGAIGLARRRRAAARAGGGSSLVDPFTP